MAVTALIYMGYLFFLILAATVVMRIMEAIFIKREGCFITALKINKVIEKMLWILTVVAVMMFILFEISIL